MEVDEPAGVAFHRPAQPEGRPKIGLSPHPDRKDRKPLRGRFFVQRAVRLDDETGRVAFSHQFSDQEKGLSLPAAPLPAGINMEKAQSALFSSRSPSAWCSGH